ncbi:MAG: helix-turn-helix transcriptional regulator [Actinomycetales bacterium]
MTASAYLTVQDLAGRWGVSRDTARSYARQADFPPALVLSARTIRWPTAEVAAWEDARRAAGRSMGPPRPAHRRTPRYIGGPLPAPARVA